MKNFLKVVKHYIIGFMYFSKNLNGANNLPPTEISLIIFL